jgi:uncharacterized repeat protein (TIGR03803 family)
MKRLSPALILAAYAMLPGVGAATAAKEQVVWSFGNGTDGSNPVADLINVRGTLYGTTTAGGEYSAGTLFSLSPDTGAEKVLWSFGNGTDGTDPTGALISVKGTFYGTNLLGGQYAYGAVFSFDAKTGRERVLWSSRGGTDSALPSGSLVYVNGTLYGTGGGGGQYNHGTVFSLDPKTGTEKVVWSFGNGTDGQDPDGSLINVAGVLYGTTVQGGQYGTQDGGLGTVFSFDPTTGQEKVLWSFGNEQDGQNAEANLIDIDGTLYGTTYLGGQYGEGTVFSIDLNTGTEHVLWSFGNEKDGENPLDGLINVKGTLYGTTYAGGQYRCQYDHCGTAFSLNPTTGTEKVVWSFGNGTDGQNPWDGVIDVKGTLYGTTSVGGQYGYGTVFSLTP